MNPTLQARLPPRVEEQRLLEVVRSLWSEGGIDKHRACRQIVAVSTGRGQASEELAAEHPDAHVTCWFIDAHFQSLAQSHAHPHSNLRMEVAEDWPELPADLTLVPLASRGEVEFSRDLLQGAFDQLVAGGILVAAIDHPKDKWLMQQLGQYEKSIKVRGLEDATVCWIQKSKPIKKRKDFRCELAFRDLDRLIKIVTRPGVFSHRELDNGARQLLDAVDVFPEARILDLGCGSGAVALGLAARDPSAQVHAVDSNARAVGCTREGAILNGLGNVTVELSATGGMPQDTPFDMALANPPYFADFRIAELFIESAKRHLRKGGRLVLVTKQPKWYEENLERWLDQVEVFDSRRYWIASGIKSQEP